MLVIPASRLRQLVAEDWSWAIWSCARTWPRRIILIGLGAGVRIIGSHFSADTRRLRELAARNRVPHRWIDLEEDPQAEGLLQQMGIRPDETPVVIWRDLVLRNPEQPRAGAGARSAATGLGHKPLRPARDRRRPGGPRGRGLRRLRRPLHAHARGRGTRGQAGSSSRIENYLGFPSGISGAELANRALLQAEKFGANVSVPAEASGFEVDGDGHYAIQLDDGTRVAGRTVVIATGAHYRKLPVPRLEDFEGTSVFYAATLVEAMVCVDDPVIVVGGGNPAARPRSFSPSTRRA